MTDARAWKAPGRASAITIGCLACGAYSSDAGTPPASPQDIVWNQQWLEAAWPEEPNIPERSCPPEARDEIADPEAHFDSPRSILEAVLRRAPADPVVYPTEGYYYFHFRLGHRRVSGNIRFAAAEAGEISIGYFDRDDPRNAKTARYRDGEDGVRVARVSSGCFRLEVRGGPSRVFRVIDHTELPRPPLPLRADEEIVASIIDESGVPFVLLWHAPSASFYYCLHDALPVAEEFDRVQGHEQFLVGRRSRFVLFESVDARRYLVGVKEEEIRKNSWFDGPFDQVPPDLNIRSKLERCYPYVRMRGGIDEHGNFCELAGQRVAISAYRDYRSLDDLIRECEAIWESAASDHDAVLQMTFESKRTFHERLADRAASPRRHWPANHWGWVSGLWPQEHAQTLSAHWPANHFPANSRQTPPRSDTQER